MSVKKWHLLSQLGDIGPPGLMGPPGLPGKLTQLLDNNKDSHSINTFLRSTRLSRIKRRQRRSRRCRKYLKTSISLECPLTQDFSNRWILPQKYRKMRRRQDEHGMSDAPYLIPEIVSISLFVRVQLINQINLSFTVSRSAGPTR